MLIQQSSLKTDQFIVKVKLLSNEVYEFVINYQTTTVLELKKKILDKIGVPVQRQRIVFSGKQLADQNKVNQYVKESGMTVHLIAKTQQQAENTTNTNTQINNQNNQQQNIQTTSNNQQNTQNQQNIPPNPFTNLMGMFGGMGGPQSATINVTNLNGLESSLNGILGGLGIRINSQPNQGNLNQPSNQQNQNIFQTPPNNNARRHQNNNNQPNQATTSTFVLPNLMNLLNPGNQPHQHNHDHQHQNNQSNQQTQQSQQNSENVNAPLNSSSGQQPSSSTLPFQVSTQQILNLNQVISTLNLPTQPVLDNSHLSLREQTAQYLRRLQHQYMRMIPQLNRSIQLLNEGRISHMSEMIRLFDAINQANTHANEAIRRLINLPANQVNVNQNNNHQNNINQQQFNQSNGQHNQQNNSDQQQNSVSIDVMQEEIDLSTLNNSNANVEATIIIQQDDILDADIDDSPTNYNNPSHQEPRMTTTGNTTTINFGNISNLGPNGLSGLSNLFGNLTGGQMNTSSTQGHSSQSGQVGLNLGGLMSMLGGNGGLNLGNLLNPQQQRPNNQPNQQSQQSLQQPQQPQQPTTQSQQQPTSQSQQQPNNPLGGLNLMGIFSSLQQSGGMGQLMSMSLGDMLQEGSHQQTIYSSLLKSFAGGDLMNCFTTKNFDFLDRKYEQIRENYLHAIPIAGSQEDLVVQLTNDLTNLVIPKQNIQNFQQCQKKVKGIIKKSVSEISRYTMNRGNAKYSQVLIANLKTAFCQAIQCVCPFVEASSLINQQTAEEFVFANIRENSIRLMSDFIEGLAGMFYGFIQRDLLRVYNEFRQQKKRKNQRSEQQIASQEELLKMIQEQSKKDNQFLKNFKFSQYYHPSKQEE